MAQLVPTRVTGGSGSPGTERRELPASSRLECYLVLSAVPYLSGNVISLKTFRPQETRG